MSHKDLPIGGDDQANPSSARVSMEPPTFDFTPLDHVVLGEKLDSSISKPLQDDRARLLLPQERSGVARTFKQQYGDPSAHGRRLHADDHARPGGNEVLMAPATSAWPRRKSASPIPTSASSPPPRSRRRLSRRYDPRRRRGLVEDAASATATEPRPQGRRSGCALLSGASVRRRSRCLLHAPRKEHEMLEYIALECKIFDGHKI